MPTVAERQSLENQIKQIIEGRKEAVRSKDIEWLISQFSEDAVLYDALDPLQLSGKSAIKNKIQTWLGSYQNEIKNEMRDLSVVASGNVAFCHFLSRYQGTLKAGNKIDMWVRFTVCLQNKNGQWFVTHEHVSAPFNPETGQASIDLKP